jgi:hypothetical protein
MSLPPYTVASAMSQSQLEQAVALLISAGYDPRGGVSIGQDGMLYQAMYLTARPAQQPGEVKLKEPKRK